MIARIVTLVVVALGVAAAARAADIRMDPDGFTQDALAQVQTIVPSGTAAATGPLTLTLTGPDKQVVRIALDRIYDYCQRVPDDCAAQLAVYIKATARFTEPSAPIAPDQLRAVLRPGNYALGAQAQLGSKPDNVLLMRPFAGDLYEMCVVDLPETAQLVNAGLLGRLNLAPDAAFARCEANIAAAEQVPQTTAEQLPPGRGDVVGGDYYESSLLLLHDAWAPLAARFGGKLLVAVPDSNTILYANGDDDHAVAAMTMAAQRSVSLAQRALSAQVFRWTPTAWEPVSP